MIKRFTGLLLILALALPGQAENGHVLNFKDADIRSLITAVADMTGKNIIIDPQVSGRVTVVSTQPLDADGVWDVFLSILRVHGYSVVTDERAVRVLPDVNARQDGRVPVDDMRIGGDEPVTRILQLEHVRASEASQLLRNLLPQSAYMVHHDSSNSLIISDRAGNVRRIEAIIRRLDTSADQDIEVLGLSHADAAEVVSLINRVYADSGREAAVADERTNTIILSGDPNRRLRLRTLISHLDTPLEREGSTQVVYLRYATADTLLPVLEGILDMDGDNGQRVRIQAHQETNALVITAAPATFRSIQSVISQLDIRRAQVLVEAIIAEVAVDTARELGIQWQAFSSGDRGLFGGTNFQSGGRNLLNLSAAAGQAAEDGSLLLPGRGLNLGYVRGRSSLLGVEILEIGALARALATDANTNVLSTPSIVTLDNHEASINVGQEVPFLSGSFATQGIATGDGQVNPFQTINREEIGVKLNVTPHINEGDTIILNINQEVSTLAPSGGAVDLITNKRTITTRVMVPDGAILVLGGLISEDLQEQLESVPGLSRIPLLGELFKYRSTSSVKRNLMVFIRPQILHDEALMDNLTRSKYTAIRDRQLEQRQRPAGLTRPGDMPLLPELDEFLQSPPDGR
ncbi:MAG: type II secretion system secretin GspD [Wenzhouxiangella sp.]|nr:type II secretion system secretin GspD [Wenzhouxiangella sp.]TVR91027.1 MAG: type II secretion system protein GspD [Wenzhouxiangellaceae bacterium]